MGRRLEERPDDVGGKRDERRWQGGQRKAERGERQEMESTELSSRLAVGSQGGRESLTLRLGIEQLNGEEHSPLRQGLGQCREHSAYVACRYFIRQQAIPFNSNTESTSSLAW